MSFWKILKSATLGHPEKLRGMILWTMAEYFFRGAPYGFAIMAIWLIFEPLQKPGTALNVWGITALCAGLLASAGLLFWANRKSYFAAYEEGYDLCAEGRREIAAHMRKLPMGFYNSRDPGDIGAYIVSDYANIEQMVTHLVPQFFGALTMPLVALGSLAFFNWRLALVGALVIPLSWPIAKLTNHIVRANGIKHQKTKVAAASRMIEYIQGIKLIKAFNLSGTRFERLEKAFRQLKTDSIRLEAAAGPTMIAATAMLNMGLILIMLMGLSLMFAGSLPMPIYIMFLVIGTRIYEPLMHALMFLAELNYMQLGVERVEELRRAPLLEEGNASPAGDFGIEMRHVYFSYHNVPVLRDCSLRIPPKSLTALVGPSGSGKTTITRLIARFWDADSGEITIGGRNVKNRGTDELLSGISMVFQDVYLFNDTIYNNIRLGREDASEEEIVAAARTAMCHDFIERLPEGYRTLVGEGGSRLSGGEKQRISIARAVLKNAPIVLLDEATASLDPENEVYIQRAIDDLVKDRTVVVIAHRLNTIRRADKIIVIDGGRVAEEGTHEQLLAAGGLYMDMWNEQQRVKHWKFRQEEAYAG